MGSAPAPPSAPPPDHAAPHSLQPPEEPSPSSLEPPSAGTPDPPSTPQELSQLLELSPPEWSPTPLDTSVPLAQPSHRKLHPCCLRRRRRHRRLHDVILIAIV